MIYRINGIRLPKRSRSRSWTCMRSSTLVRLPLSSQDSTDILIALNDALKTAKQEAKELKLQLAQVQDQTVAPIPRAASPPIAASQPKGKGKQAEASAAAIAEAYERGVREGNQRVADLEAEGAFAALPSKAFR